MAVVTTPLCLVTGCFVGTAIYCAADRESRTSYVDFTLQKNAHKLYYHHINLYLW